MKLESFFKLPAYDFGLETNRHPPGIHLVSDK
jgi:hypothetical protein